MHPDILFDDNTLSQQESGLMEDITCDPDDTDAWMWSFDDDDASRDATKNVGQILVKYFLSIYLIPRFLVDNVFLSLTKGDHNTCSLTPRPRRVCIIVSLTIPFRRAVKRVYVEATRGNHPYSDDQHLGQGKPRVVGS